jgi:hypothetical protein
MSVHICHIFQHLQAHHSHCSNAAPLTVKEMFVVATLPAAAMTKDDTPKQSELHG